MIVLFLTFYFEIGPAHTILIIFDVVRTGDEWKRDAERNGSESERAFYVKRNRLDCKNYSNPHADGQI